MDFGSGVAVVNAVRLFEDHQAGTEGIGQVLGYVGWQDGFK